MHRPLLNSHSNIPDVVWITGAGTLTMKSFDVCLAFGCFPQDYPERVGHRRRRAWGVCEPHCMDKLFLGGVQVFVGMNIGLSKGVWSRLRGGGFSIPNFPNTQRLFAPAGVHPSHHRKKA